VKQTNHNAAPAEAPVTQRSFKTFEDLEVYRLSREFRRGMYAVARGLPESERFGLAGQIRRAAVSLTNNIAEGHGRFHYLDQIRFTLISRGSLEELIDDLNVCEDERYLPAEEIAALRESAWRIHRMLAGYLRYLREQKQGASLALHETDSPSDLFDGEEEPLGSSPL